MFFPSLVISTLPVALGQYSRCRCFPGDACWPSPNDWAELNKTVGGNLVATTPLAAACHNDSFAPYNEAQCKQLQSNWWRPETHYDSSSSVQTPYFANQSCDPFTPRTAQCVIGSYVQYAIDVRSASDVRAGIEFATKRNIRLVVRNTGHDYSGRSTGAGALALWIHHLKSIDFKDYKDAHYSGVAIKMGAGVQGFEAYNAASARGLQVVGGECPTVGLAGGYTQGGGHSILMTAHGLGADQTLEWEVMTGTGEYVIANRQQNTDLYWALSGGGGGTYGVVLSMTAKAYEDTPIVGANITFNRTDHPDPFYEAIETYYASLPAVVDGGATSFGWGYGPIFGVGPLSLRNGTEEQAKKMLSPLVQKLEQHNITYKMVVKSYDTYLEHFHDMFSYVGVGTYQAATRFVPRSTVQHPDSRAQLMRAIRRQMETANTTWSSIAFNVADKGSDNAVHPGWRSAIIIAYATTTNDIAALPSVLDVNNRRTVEELLPQYDGIAAGTYMNEACWAERKDWHTTFYGPNYDKLNAIKDKYDPNHIFYGLTSVGSEYWVQQPDGRLCRAWV